MVKQEKQELHSDIIEELDKKESKAKTVKKALEISQNGSKRVQKSIGWYKPNTEYYKMCDEKGKSWLGAPKIEKEVWDVNLENGGIFTAESQEIAEVLNFLAQINFRLKRMEERMKETEEDIRELSKNNVQRSK